MWATLRAQAMRMGMGLETFDGMSLRMFDAIVHAYAAMLPGKKRPGRRAGREVARGGLTECP